MITGGRDAEARLCLARFGMRVDALAGGVIGEAKAPAMGRHRIDVFVGDHVLDMAGAWMASVPAIGLLSGTHDESALRRAGAVRVPSSVATLSAWFVPPPDGAP